MSAEQQLNELAERRRLLVLEADLQRNIITLECENIRDHLRELQTARERATHHPLFMAGSAAAGLFALRHWRKVARWAPAALSAFRWIKSFTGRST